MKYNAQNLARALLKLIQENRQDEEKIISSFVDFCRKEGLAYLLGNLLRYFKIEAERKEDTETLKIFSAVKLDESMKREIQKLVTADSLSEIKIVEDKKIIAGFVAYYKNKVIDASLSSNLHSLKNKLINA